MHAEAAARAGVAGAFEVLDEVASSVAFNERWSILQRELLDEPAPAESVLLALSCRKCWPTLWIGRFRSSTRATCRLSALPGCAPRTLVVVLDRSGSMAGDRLSGAKTALLELVDRLAPADRFGVVTFDTRVQVVIPAAPLTDKAAAKAGITTTTIGFGLGYDERLLSAIAAGGNGS